MKEKGADENPINKNTIMRCSQLEKPAGTSTREYRLQHPCFPALHPLGREPLTASEASAPRGFARYLQLPPDADLDSATAGMISRTGGFFQVVVKRLPSPPPSPGSPASRGSSPLLWSQPRI